jgi:methyltransferase family protein
MDPRWPPYPVLSAEHVVGARLYANRGDQISLLGVPKNGRVAEIGVWRGAFSKDLVETLKPREFVAFDLFDGHEVQDWNGMSGKELFDGLTHRQFYERQMAAFQDVTTIVEGSSLETLRAYSDHSFDLVYIDGNHAYEFVKSDAAFASQMVSETGILVFNDYMMVDLNHANYGVVPVVNEMVVNQGWQVVGFALHHAMYCDIAIRRRNAPASAA